MLALSRAMIAAALGPGSAVMMLGPMIGLLDADLGCGSRTLEVISSPRDCSLEAGRMAVRSELLAALAWRFRGWDTGILYKTRMQEPNREMTGLVASEEVRAGGRRQHRQIAPWTHQ